MATHTHHNHIHIHTHTLSHTHTHTHTIRLLALAFLLFSLPPAECACGPYLLDNECAPVVGPSVDALLSQQALFDFFLALPFSDIRMVPAECRRAAIWYFCHLVFPTCVEGAGLCVMEEESCQLTVSLCANYPNITQNIHCSAPSRHSSSSSHLPSKSSSLFVEERRSQLPSSLSSQVCTENLTVSFIESTPIPVTTCISGSPNVTVSCCPTPFVRASEGECVYPCMQYGFGETKENAWSLAALIMVWTGTVLYIFGAIPIYSLTRWWVFPTIAIHCTEVNVLIVSHIFIWSTYVGTQQYVCGEEIVDFLTKYEEYLNSNKCRIQSWMFSYFLLAVLTWLCALSLNISAQAFR